MMINVAYSVLADLQLMMISVLKLWVELVLSMVIALVMLSDEERWNIDV